MKARELRIGNITSMGVVCSIEDNFFRVLDSEGDTFKNTWADIQPIPLTGEWLFKFGFEFNINANCQNFHYAKDAFICIRADEDFEWFRYYNGDFYHELKYVHQLQNLHFALTGEELTIKQQEQ